MKFITNIHKISLPIRSRQIVKKIIKKNITKKNISSKIILYFPKKKIRNEPNRKNRILRTTKPPKPYNTFNRILDDKLVTHIPNNQKQTGER